MEEDLNVFLRYDAHEEVIDSTVALLSGAKLGMGCKSFLFNIFYVKCKLTSCIV